MHCSCVNELDLVALEVAEGVHADAGNRPFQLTPCLLALMA